MRMDLGHNGGRPGKETEAVAGDPPYKRSTCIGGMRKAELVSSRLSVQRGSDAGEDSIQLLRRFRRCVSQKRSMIASASASTRDCCDADLGGAGRWNRGLRAHASPAMRLAMTARIHSAQPRTGRLSVGIVVLSFRVDAGSKTDDSPGCDRGESLVAERDWVR